MILFRNPGLIEMAAVTTMGVSVKEGDSPIGYFGTGLKFAIATILRIGGSITIWRDGIPHFFQTRPEEIRGKQFDLIWMDDEPLAFTTELGKNWKSWMAYRELASNCKDEGGYRERVNFGDDWQAQKGETVIEVEGLDDIHSDRASILLESSPVAICEEAEIHRGPSPFIFYRGIRVHQLARPSFMKWNITRPLDLTEDRTAQNPWQIGLALERSIGALEDAELCRQIMTCGDQFFEHSLDIRHFGNPNETFGEVARLISMASENTKANPSAIKYARESAIRHMKEGDGMALDDRQNAMLIRATNLLARAGYAVQDFPIICLDTLGPNIHGMAKDGRIFIAAAAFEKGTRELAATIFEEYAHLRSGCNDASRDFQNWLIDRILIKAEEFNGEAF